MRYVFDYAIIRQHVLMHRFLSTVSKTSIAELQIALSEEQPEEQEDDLFNDDAFNNDAKSKTHTSWTCVAAGPIANLSLQPQQSMLVPHLKSEMTAKEIDGMMSHQNWRIYNVLQMQALRISKFSEGMFCFLETPNLTENEKGLVKFLPGQRINASSHIFWKFFIANNDMNMRSIPRDWRILSRHASGIRSDIIIQPFVAEILRCLYEHQEGFDQFHLHAASLESCSFSIFSTLQGHFEAGARINILKIIADVVVNGEFKLEFLATVDVCIYSFPFVTPCLNHNLLLCFNHECRLVAANCLTSKSSKKFSLL